MDDCCGWIWTVILMLGNDFVFFVVVVYVVIYWWVFLVSFGIFKDLGSLVCNNSDSKWDLLKGCVE